MCEAPWKRGAQRRVRLDQFNRGFSPPLGWPFLAFFARGGIPRTPTPGILTSSPVSKEIGKGTGSTRATGSPLGGAALPAPRQRPAFRSGLSR